MLELVVGYNDGYDDDGLTDEVSEGTKEVDGTGDGYGVKFSGSKSSFNITSHFCLVESSWKVSSIFL